MYDPDEFPGGGQVYIALTDVVIGGTLGGNWANRACRIVIFYVD